MSKKFDKEKARGVFKGSESEKLMNYKYSRVDKYCIDKKKIDKIISLYTTTTITNIAREVGLQSNHVSYIIEFLRSNGVTIPDRPPFRVTLNNALKDYINPSNK